MRRVNITIPIYLPMPLYRLLSTIRKKLRGDTDYRYPLINLVGDRAIEWSWIMSRVPVGPGEALDFGAETSYLGLFATQKGFNVLAVDLNPLNLPYVHPNLRPLQGDLLALPLPSNHFDLIINCSTVEHVGLTGRYDVSESKPDGDLEAMARLLKMLKPNGLMLLTIPVGIDEVFAPFCRVYGSNRLPQLLKGYNIEEESYWVKDEHNRWIACEKERAMHYKAYVPSSDGRKDIYALGAFQLSKP
jgi:SAM-dependent methyltransferase